MRASVGLLVLGLIMLVTTTTALGQAVVLVSDDFEAPSLDTSIWCHADLYGNPGNYGVLPEILYDGPIHGSVMHVDSPTPGWKQRVGSLIASPPFVEGQALVVSMDVRRNTAETVFAVQTRKLTVQNGTHFGCITTIPETAVWGLPKVTYWPGVSQDYLYPSSGFWVRVPSSLHCCGNDDYYVTDIRMDPGVWYSLDLVFTRALFALSLDGTVIFEVDNPYYDFDRVDDWLVLIGDNDTEGTAPCDLSVDNVLIQLVLLDGAEASPPKAHLHLVELTRGDGGVSATLVNIGASQCSGELSVTAGLSYSMSWAPEWCTRFFEEELGSLVLRPGEAATLEIQLPDVPPALFDVLVDRLEEFWTGYTDPDPADYIGLIFSLGTDKCFGYLDLQ